ncbi:STAS domain-containing protein [Catellatospora coxensis]|uniref:STAS domain-containing protein n=1 Tax=Catellatospora coxensis TaxID=310354 RepID=A0A8J3P6L1_9ACTN|nr:STAS domain-containing protein [Catellatospora coxensis]GIG05644.1 hypothetical protein Cco03nite_23440 [Catellatospora coxensis]
MTGSRLHLRLQATATGLRLVACGRLDAATGRQLGQAISLALHRLRAQRLTLDLTAVNAIDAAGVAALIRGRVEADRCDVVLTIADPSPALLHAMRLHAAGAPSGGETGLVCIHVPRPVRRCVLRPRPLRHRRLHPMR